MKFVSHSPEDTQKIATTLAEKFLAGMPGRSGALIIALEGELGAGKTTFVQGFAKALGISEQPKSPTFNLVKEYRIPNSEYRVFHIDCYRLSSHKDLATLHIHDAFSDPHAIFLIEWAQNISGALPADHIVIRFEHAGNDKREISINTDPTRT